MSDCRDSFEQLYRYLDGDLETLSITEIEVHLKNCRRCWDRFEFERYLIDRVKQSCHREQCPDSLRQRIKGLLDKY